MSRASSPRAVSAYASHCADTRPDFGQLLGPGTRARADCVRLAPFYSAVFALIRLSRATPRSSTTFSTSSGGGVADVKTMPPLPVSSDSNVGGLVRCPDRDDTSVGNPAVVLILFERRPVSAWVLLPEDDQNELSAGSVDRREIFAKVFARHPVALQLVEEAQTQPAKLDAGKPKVEGNSRLLINEPSISRELDSRRLHCPATCTRLCAAASASARSAVGAGARVRA